MLKYFLNKKYSESNNNSSNQGESLLAFNWRGLKTFNENKRDYIRPSKLRCNKIDSSESESFLSTKSRSNTNLLVAPKEITKLFHPKEERDSRIRSGRFFKQSVKENNTMDYFHNQNGSEISDGYLSQEESTCNQELLMPKLRNRKMANCFRDRDYPKLSNNFTRDNQKHSKVESVEERTINVGLLKTNIANHPTIVEREIKVVKDKRLRMSLPSIESSTKNVEILHYGADSKESGDTIKGELSEFLSYPVKLEELKIPKKRELHRLIHHRLCNYLNPDIVLLIENHEFFCHRIVLQSYSKYFDGINNLTDDNVIIIKEKGVTKQAFIAIYAWMLSLNESGLKYITRENFVEVLISSQVLQIRDLEEQCLALIDSKEVFSEGHAYQLFKQATRLEQKGIKEIMVPRIQHFFLPFVSTQDFIELPLDDICTFLSSSYIVVHSEMEVFMSAARWLLEDWNERKQHLPAVMNCVRFGLMNPLELVDIRKNPESPEFLKITEDSTIQKYIEDGLAYSTYSTMKGRTEDIKYRCQLFGLEIPQPRNWADTPKYYKSYGEFLNYLKQIRTNPLKIIEDNPTGQVACPCNTDGSSFLEFSPPLHTFTDGIPSMSDLLSAGLRNKAKRDKEKDKKLKKQINSEEKFKNKKKIEHLYLSEKNSEDEERYINSRGSQKPMKLISLKKEPSLKWRAATIIQAAFRGYIVRKKYSLLRKDTDITRNVKKKGGKSLGHRDHSNGSSEENQRQRLLRRSSSDINIVSINKSAQVPGSLYFPNQPTIIIIGGFNPQLEHSHNNDGKAVLRYSLELNKWERVSSLPKGRFYHSAVFLKGKIYVVGGVDPKSEEPCICGDVWSFNPSNSDWSKERCLRTPRINFGLVAYQGCLYAVGGQGVNDAILSSVEKYDPAKRTWEDICPLPEPRLSPAVTVFGGTIWVAGGMGKYSMSSQVYAYDPRHNMWSNKPALRTGKGFSVLINHDDKLYLVGGAEKEKERGSSTSSDSIEVFDPKQNKWDILTRMKTPRHSHTSVVIDNCLFVIGGTTTQQMKSLNEVEIWSHENRAWKRHVPNLPTVLTGLAAVVLPSQT